MAVAASPAFTLSSAALSTATWAPSVTFSAPAATASLAWSVLLGVRNTCPPRVGRWSWPILPCLRGSKPDACNKMSPTPEVSDLQRLLAAQRTLEVATGIVMHWDRVDTVTSRCSIERMAIHKGQGVEEVSLAIISFAALGRRTSAMEGS